MSDFHSITPYGSKVCHGSVMGVTVPPLQGQALGGQEERKENMYIHAKRNGKGN